MPADKVWQDRGAAAAASNLAVAFREPSSLAAALTPPPSAVVLDFDETLWLRNSTEYFLDAARPRWLAHILALMVDALGKFVWFRSAGRYRLYRDWLRIRAIATLMPWHLRAWRDHAAVVGPQFRNDGLWLAVRRSGAQRVGVVTIGFREIVGPLLEAAAPGVPLWGSCHLGWNGWRLRKLGKISALAGELPSDVVVDSVVVTDGVDDLAMAPHVRRVALIRWPKAEFIPAFRDAYFPFKYTERAKRPGKRYAWGAVFRVDVAVAVLAALPLAENPLTVFLGLSLVFVSFWCVYELGYMENDRLGAKLEAKPVIAPEHSRFQSPAYRRQAWTTAAVTGSLAVAVFTAGTSPSDGSVWVTAALLAAAWLMWLAATRLIFALFNRLDERSRAYVHLLLQVARGFPSLLFAPTAAVGVAAMSAVAIGRWFPYLIYRWQGMRSTIPYAIVPLLLFILLAIPLLLAEPSRTELLATVLLAINFLVYARRELHDLLHTVTWLPSARRARSEPTSEAPR